jgi:UDP-N-acetylglucosamine 2-epimerase (non-hydrolysing)
LDDHEPNTQEERLDTYAPQKVMVVIGTRPEAIKLAPVVLELVRHRAHFDSKICVTGQHREMLDQMLGVFGLRPDYDLGVMTAGQDLAGVTATCLTGLDLVLRRERPGLVLVQGDTTTTLAASLAAYCHHIPVGHIEAGLRTGEEA